MQRWHPSARQDDDPYIHERFKMQAENDGFFLRKLLVSMVRFQFPHDSWRKGNNLSVIDVKKIPSLKLTVRPSKFASPKGKDRLPNISFQGLLLSVASFPGNF